MNRNLTYFIFMVLILAISSCKKEREYHTVTDKIKAEEKTYHGKLSSEELLENTELIKIIEGDHTFLIPERKGQIKLYSCLECHSKPLAQMKSTVGQKAHWDIKLNHANNETMNCVTCHDGNDMNSLKTITGLNIDMNLSHKVCAQCHSSQFEDWKGGAHGKKVAGWSPPRASFTCVNCHNPHSPGFETRWPAQFNTQKDLQRKEGLDH